MSQRVMEVVIRGRNELGKSIGEARAQLDKLRRESRADPGAFSLDAGARPSSELRRVYSQQAAEAAAIAEAARAKQRAAARAEAIRRVQFEREWQRKADAASFADWRAQENQKSMLTNRLFGAAAATFALNGIKRVAAAMKDMSEAVARGDATMGELVDTTLRAVPIFGAAYSATRDFVSVFSGEAAKNARELARAQADLARAESQRRLAAANKSRFESLSSQAAELRRTFEVSRQLVDVEARRARIASDLAESERRVNKERTEGLNANPLPAVGSPDYASALRTRQRINSGADSVIAGLRRNATVDAIRVERDAAESARRLDAEVYAARLRNVGKLAAAEREELNESFRARMYGVAEEERVKLNSLRNLALADFDRQQREERSRRDTERHNDRAQRARNVAEAYFGRSITPYNPTVTGVLAGQQFSGIGAMAQSSAGLQNARDAAEQKRLLQRMTELLASVLAVNQQMARAFPPLAGLQFGSP